MKYRLPFAVPVRALLAAVAGWLLVALSPSLLAQAAGGTGAIRGRVLNQATGQYLRSAIITVAGTDLSTVSESGGDYTLTGVPAGQARVKVTFTGLDPVETTVPVTAGQTIVQDFTMLSKADSGEVLRLGEVRVVTEREGNAKAIQEQLAALEMKTVVSSDAFGETSEGNVGEFLKLMPGVMMDYVDADVRTASIGGLDPKYAVDHDGRRAGRLGGLVRDHHGPRVRVRAAFDLQHRDGGTEQDPHARCLRQRARGRRSISAAREPSTARAGRSAGQPARSSTPTSSR
jgi:iron complex outermembrane receptor protein